MKHLRFLVLAALVAMPLMACDDDKGGTTVVPVTGTISGSVTAEGAGVAGVSVTLVGATSQSATTAAGGAYSFTGVEAGSYGVAINGFPADVSFSTVSKTTSITTAGQVATVDFSGSFIRTASISGNVSASGEGLAAVAVTMTGPEGAKSAVTDAAGNYSTSGLRSGDYSVSIDVPVGYIFANSSFDVSVGVGQAQNVSFVGEAEVTIDPVTASVLIKSVQWDDGEFVDPSDVSDDIYVTLAIDKGENKLQQVCVLLDGAEVPNGCQTLSSATEGEMLQGNILEPTFAILTDDFDSGTGAPLYNNGNHQLAARLDLVGAVQSSVTTTMALTFDNSDRVYAELDPEFNMLVSGDRWLGGLQTVTFTPVLYSGKELAWLEFYFRFDGWGTEYFDVEPDTGWPFTDVYDFTDQDDFGFTTDDIDDSYVYVNDGEYTDGTSFNSGNYARLMDTDEIWFNFDFEGPEWDEDLYLTDQVIDIEDQCCANNWVGPDYMPIAGFYGDLPYDDGVGVDEDNYITFYVDAYDALDDGDDPDGTPITQMGTMLDAALPLSLTNDVHDLTAVAVDLFGNWTWIALEGNGDSNDTDLTFGYDDTAPTGQVVATQPPDMIIYNIADAVAGVDLGGLSVGASEDRSGFSSVPFRGYMQWWDADDTEFPIGQDIDDGGAVNLEMPIGSCTSEGAMPCYPDWDWADGVFYLTGSMNNQGGVAVETMVEGWVYNDQTSPLVNANVSVPNFIFLGQPMSFSVPVEDNLHLGKTSFGFQLTGITDVWFPLGPKIPNSAGDQDPWDGNFPTEETASTTITPAIMGVQLYPALAAPVRYDAVRAIHTDLAGNQSGISSNNILATSFSDAPVSFNAAGITAFSTTEPSAAVDLCNGKGLVACDDAAIDGETSVELEIVAQGAAGTFPNPFATGELYIYLRTDGGALGVVDAGDVLYLVDIMDAGAAVITDEGAGGNRYYTWTFDITSDDVAQFPDGTNVYVHVMGLKYSTGTALLDAAGNANITVVDGS